MAEGARAGVLDPIKKGQICAIIAVGGSRTTAAHYVGCVTATIRNTALRDPEFAEALQRAESDLEVVHLANIKQAAKKSWNASAWVLERLFPERYARRGPDTIAVADLKEVLAGFSEIIAQEVEDSGLGERLAAKMEALLAQYQKPVSSKP